MPYRSSLVLAVLALALSACEPGPLAPTYENVATIFESSCSFNSCHGGTRGAARLNFDEAIADGVLFTDLLVGTPSCEYDRMPLIDPGRPENSWLYIKITQAHDEDGYIAFTPADDWEPPVLRNGDGTLRRQTCPLVEDSGGEISFGTIMPDGSSNGLDMRRATAIREWILAGAPGPDGTPTEPRDAGMRDTPPPVDAPRADAPPAPADTAPIDAPEAEDASEIDAP